MKKFTRPAVFFAAAALLFSCEHLDDFIGDGGTNGDGMEGENPVSINFTHKKTFTVGGEGAAEISAFDAATGRLFTVNVEKDVITVYDISNVDAPMFVADIALNGAGAPNSVAVKNGILAVAVEQEVKQDNGYVKFYDTESLQFISASKVGALPDMVTFTPDGTYVILANEGEPNDDYTVDPKGTISIVEVATGACTHLDFEAFNGAKESLLENGFRVFGPNASLAMDVEPEYVAVSDDGKKAWVSLQENNGVAVVNLETKTIETILPLGYKDYSLPGNEIDPSDKDDKTELRSVPVFGTYHPDAIAYYSVNGMDYIVTANEGDAREYEGDPGFVEEERIKDIVLDPTAFPDWENLQADENLGRLKITLTKGDIDNDGDFDELYSFGARSFTIWTGTGEMVYDSGNDIAQKTLELTPDTFNGEDGRSDDKGAEPEAVTVQKIGNKHILFVGLERNNQVLVYDVSNPAAPEFIQLLETSGDVAPEGVLAIAAADSPTGKDLLVVSNEVSGTVTIYEN
ncbi:choice-of-anchor I family protein [Flavobacterium sp. ASW18X]|uniref:choice-of-anchor I family protein n=1 Tax=Flavobacterium sp. ASW18X TaxID=2572595 RepID=UPI0010AE7FD2|nr:choice-of-anchor I family protein [Flavobacterium sp. ASW18X]TKD60523.1 alkaline phosphatase [Flavobacterium sp. ASW18X]